MQEGIGYTLALMKKPNPRHLTMVICDSVIEDKRTREKSLIGIFNNITASSVPCVHPRLNVFVALTEGHGVYGMLMRCLKVGDESEIMKMDGNVTFKDPRQIIEFNCEIVGLKFPDYGEYRFEVLFDGNPVVSRKFKVSPEGEGA